MVKEPTLSIVSANVLHPILYLYCLLVPIFPRFHHMYKIILAYCSS